MLVIHWAKQNKTSSILANGIRPSFRSVDGQRYNPKGVYVYPYSRNKTLIGNWRRNLKTWDTNLGNYNGFVFKLEPEDFPVLAGYWFFIRKTPVDHFIKSPKELTSRYGDFFSGKILEYSAEGFSYNRFDFEIIIPKQIEPNRIIKVIRDREPKKLSRKGLGRDPLVAELRSLIESSR